MGFEFQPFRSDYGSTIGELLGHSADAQAAALRAKAAAWSGAFTNIGQIVGALPQEIQQAHRQQTTDQLNDLKLADAKRQVAGQHAVAGLMAGDQLAPGDTGPRRESYLGDDGLFDIKKITASLGSSGFGDMAGDLVSGAEKINDSILKHQQLQQQTSDAHTVMLGDLANGALTLGKTGMPLDQAMDFVVQPALAKQRIDPAEYAQVRQHLLQLPADQQGAALTALMDQAAKVDKGETLAEGAQRIDRYGRVVASGASKPKTTAELADDAANPNSPTRAQSQQALSLLKPPKTPADTAAEMDAEAQRLFAKQNLGQTLTPEEAASLKAYQQRRTVPTDAAAAAAADRQGRTEAEQNALTRKRQDFEQAQAGRKELTEKVEQPLQTALASAQTLRDVVSAAKAGNKVAASLQSLEATMSAIRAQGLNRINSSEIGVTANAGDLYDTIVGRLGKLSSGQPVPSDLQKDMQDFAAILEKAAYKKYSDAFDSTTKRYKLTDEQKLPAPGGATPAPSPLTPGLQGVLNR